MKYNKDTEEVISIPTPLKIKEIVMGLFAVDGISKSEEAISDIVRNLYRFNLRVFYTNQKVADIISENYNKSIGEINFIMPDYKRIGASIDDFLCNNDTLIDGVIFYCDDASHYPMLNAIANIIYANQQIPAVAFPNARQIARTFLDHNRNKKTIGLVRTPEEAVHTIIEQINQSTTWPMQK